MQIPVAQTDLFFWVLARVTGLTAFVALAALSTATWL